MTKRARLGTAVLSAAGAAGLLLSLAAAPAAASERQTGTVKTAAEAPEASTSSERQTGTVKG